jgi:hypothetical protein
MSFDLNNLPNEVLFYSNEQFFNFIETCLGADELELMTIQGIKNTRALLHITDILSIIDLDCDALNNIKKRICFDTKNKGFVIKEGIRCGIQDLIGVLKKKNTEYLKRFNRLTSFSQLPLRDVSNSLTLSEHDTSQLMSPTPTMIFSNATTNHASSSSIECERWILDAIDKFCTKTFNKVNLVNKIDYTILLTQSPEDTCSRIKCRCGSMLKIIHRHDTSSFHLSAFYKHVRESNCLMMKSKRDVAEAPDVAIHSTEESEENEEDGTDDSISDSDHASPVVLTDRRSVSRRGRVDDLSERRPTSSRESRSNTNAKKSRIS